MVWPGAINQLYYNTVPDIYLLSIKYYIYTNRCLKQKLSFHSLKACLIDLCKTEKMIAVRNQRIAEFQLHWSTFEKLFEDCWHIFHSYVNSLSIEKDIEKIRLYFILAFICKTFMVWPVQTINWTITLYQIYKRLFGRIKYSYCFNYPVMSILLSIL
jgi:hypothetical protein